MKTNEPTSERSESNPKVESLDRLQLLEMQMQSMVKEHASMAREHANMAKELSALRHKGNGHYNGNGTSVLEAPELTALTDRRGMMKKMAGLAAGVAAVGLLRPMTAAAKGYGKGVPDATGGNMIIGSSNAPTSPPDVTFLINPGSVLFPKLLQVDNYSNTIFPAVPSSIISIVGHVNDAGATPTGQNLYGVYGQATATQASNNAFGVIGVAGTIAAPSGDGVTGIGSRGVVGVGSGGGCGVDGSVNSTDPIAYGVLGTSVAGAGGTFAGGRAALFLGPGPGAVANPNTTPPAGNDVGDIYRGSTNGSIWYRTNAAANPYRRLADATTAGALTLLTTPLRYVDTRNGTGGATGAFAPGEVRSYDFVMLQPGTIPAGATGIVGNIVAVSPNTTGNMQINTANSFPDGSAAVLNFNPGQDIGNHFVSALSGASLLFVKANPNGGSVQLVIDIYGYYL